MIPDPTCARPACFAQAESGKALCRYCDRIYESAFIVGLCLIGAGVIVIAARCL